VALKNSALETTNACSAKYTIEGELNVSKLVPAGKGVLDSNGQTLKLNSFLAASGTGEVKFGASEVKIAVDFEMGSGITLEAGTSVIKLTTNKAEFNGGGKTFNRVIFEGAEITVNGSNAFAELELLTKGKAATKFARASKGVPTTQTITTLNGLKGNGTATEFIKLKANEAAEGGWNIASSSNQTVKFFELTESHASGATFTDEYEAPVTEAELNISENSGWTFTKAGGVKQVEGTAKIKLKASQAASFAALLEGTTKIKNKESENVLSTQALTGLTKIKLQDANNVLSAQTLTGFTRVKVQTAGEVLSAATVKATGTMRLGVNNRRITTKLLGSEEEGGGTLGPAVEKPTTQRYECQVTGPTNRIEIVSGATVSAPEVEVALLADSGGTPGAVLSSGILVAPKVGKVLVPISPQVEVVAGTFYWIAILIPSGEFDVKSGPVKEALRSTGSTKVAKISEEGTWTAPVSQASRVWQVASETLAPLLTVLSTQGMTGATQIKLQDTGAALQNFKLKGATQVRTRAEETVLSTQKATGASKIKVAATGASTASYSVLGASKIPLRTSMSTSVAFGIAGSSKILTRAQARISGTTTGGKKHVVWIFEE
jgi:hypothetical protein